MRPGRRRNAQDFEIMRDFVTGGRSIAGLTMGDINGLIKSWRRRHVQVKCHSSALLESRVKLGTSAPAKVCNSIPDREASVAFLLCYMLAMRDVSGWNRFGVLARICGCVLEADPPLGCDRPWMFDGRRHNPLASKTSPANHATNHATSHSAFKHAADGARNRQIGRSPSLLGASSVTTSVMNGGFGVPDARHGIQHIAGIGREVHLSPKCRFVVVHGRFDR
mmetsp:Transcript_77712/g.197467  ORF Transcript_77712/g.197467 Transcript_77712/m.197467 type:complete len:222 (-) Transcript_77712:225-890(-)